MDWQQKLDAIQSFSCRAELIMRKPGDWYLSTSMSIGGDGMLRGEYGNGTTPQEAVEDHWRIYSELPLGRYAVNRENDRAAWNGYMWKPVSAEQVA